MEPKLVSVCLITYNHIKYIKQALDSIIMQNVNFTWELIIADDFSTDGTRAVILEYKKKHPNFIKLILQEKNVGPAKNWLDLITSPSSRYIAYFEGDDYWTDPYKLQKQFDFMEQNQEFVMCFHNATIINELNHTSKLFGEYNKTDYLGKDLFKTWLIPTASIFFRNDLPNEFPSFFQKATHGDLALFLYLSIFGKIKYIDEVMSVYRINSNGVTQSSLNGINHNLKHIEQLELMIDYFKEKYRIELNQRIANYLISIGYLYAKEGKKKEAIKYFYKANKINKIEIFKNVKYIIKSFYYLLKY